MRGSALRVSSRGRSTSPRPISMTCSPTTTTRETNNASPPGPTVSCSGAGSTPRTGTTPIGPQVTLFDLYLSASALSFTLAVLMTSLPYISTILNFRQSGIEMTDFLLLHQTLLLQLFILTILFSNFWGL